MFDHKFIEQENGNTLLIDLKGEFDTAGAQRVQEQLEAYNAEVVDRIIFDLTQVTLMPSSGLRVVFYAKDKIRKNMCVQLKGAQGLVAKVLKMSGINKFVDVI